MWLRHRGATEVAHSQPIIGDFTDGRPTPVRSIRVLAISSVLIILSASASVYALSTYPVKPKTVAPTATQITQANVAPVVAAPAPTVTVPVKTVATSRAVTPNCQPGSDPMPSAIALSDSSSGVVSQTDSDNSYRVYGTSTSAIWAQINRCSPVRSGGVFAGDTSYELNYVYRFAAGSDGLCRVASAAVSMHVSQVFPTWSPNADTPGSVTAAWNSFNAGLHTHENGHVSIDNSYAQKMYSAMISAQPAGSCADLQASVNASVSSLQSQLDAANNAYDASTGHGRTQGATL